MEEFMHKSPNEISGAFSKGIFSGTQYERLQESQESQEWSNIESNPIFLIL